MTLENYAADIPESLQWADELLTRFGRWTRTGTGKATCGSAEGNYRAPAKGDDDLRRAPQALKMEAAEAIKVNRALYGVPDQERIVLQMLYIPRRQPISAQIRILRLPAKLCRMRHETGLRMFANRYQVGESLHMQRFAL